MESEKDPRVHALRKARWREDDVVGALAFVSGEGIRDGLERDQGLNAGAADSCAGAIGGVVGGETKILRQPAEVGSGDEIQLVRAQWFVGVNQTVNPVILKVQVAGGGVEGEARGIAQAAGEPSQVRRRHVGAVVRDCEHEDGVARQGSSRAGDAVIRKGGRVGRRGKIVLRTQLEEQVMTVGLARSFADAQSGVWMIP